jgi:hypothetical protein
MLKSNDDLNKSLLEKISHQKVDVRKKMHFQEMELLKNLLVDSKKKQKENKEEKKSSDEKNDNENNKEEVLSDENLALQLFMKEQEEEEEEEEEKKLRKKSDSDNYNNNINNNYVYNNNNNNNNNNDEDNNSNNYLRYQGIGRSRRFPHMIHTLIPGESYDDDNDDGYNEEIVRETEEEKNERLERIRSDRLINENADIEYENSKNHDQAIALSKALGKEEKQKRLDNKKNYWREREKEMKKFVEKYFVSDININTSSSFVKVCTLTIRPPGFSALPVFNLPQEMKEEMSNALPVPVRESSPSSSSSSAFKYKVTSCSPSASSGNLTLGCGKKKKNNIVIVIIIRVIIINSNKILINSNK